MLKRLCWIRDWAVPVRNKALRFGISNTQGFYLILSSDWNFILWHSQSKEDKLILFRWLPGSCNDKHELKNWTKQAEENTWINYRQGTCPGTESSQLPQLFPHSPIKKSSAREQEWYRGTSVASDTANNSASEYFILNLCDELFIRTILQQHIIIYLYYINAHRS